MKRARNVVTTALFALWCVVLFHPAAAQETYDRDIPVARFSVSTNLVKVPVSIFDEQGLITKNLRKEDFRLWENQSPQEIRSLGIDTGSVSALLILDTSPTSKSELSKMKRAAETFIESLEKDDRISLITFDENVNLVIDWTSDTKRIKKALSGIRTGSRTALYDAMYLAANEQMHGVDGQKAIILFTDCVNNHSRVNFEEAASAVRKSQASFYLVSKPDTVKEQALNAWQVAIVEDIYKKLFDEDMNGVEQYFENRERAMTGLAESTGGRVFYPTSYDAIRGIYSEIARELKNKYYLTYISNQNLAPDSWHRISVEYLRPASEVVYRRGYYYLPETPRIIAGPSFDQSK